MTAIYRATSLLYAQLVHNLLDTRPSILSDREGYFALIVASIDTICSADHCHRKNWWFSCNATHQPSQALGGGLRWVLATTTRACRANVT